MTKNDIDILKHAAINGFNVLLIGNHGVGKTAIVRAALDDLGLTWKYFSASTIDPWVDLVGVPKEKGGVLDLIRPATLDFENLEVIFLDEYNRAPKKVRNACMELIQFQSINGKKFPKLKLVIAAINPDDEEELNYDVEKLDPAQIDRFHIHLPIKSVPDGHWFKNTYANSGVSAVKWWNEQSANVKAVVSPRRLEAAVRVFLAKGDVKYVFDPQIVNVSEFCDYMNLPDPTALLDSALAMTDDEKKLFLRDSNNLKHVRKDLLGKERYLTGLVRFLPDEELMKEMRNKKGSKLVGYVVSNIAEFQHLSGLVMTNRTAYSGRIVDAFVEHGRNSGAVASSTKNRTVTIKGKEIAVSDMMVCFSGKLTTWTRQEAEDMISKYGASITSQVNLRTTHLVVGNKTGAKVARATTQGVEVLVESEYLALIQELNAVGV